jgi:sugar (pentulose or hexulose) kinase
VSASATIGIDLGTSAVKAVLVDPDDRVVVVVQGRDLLCVKSLSVKWTPIFGPGHKVEEFACS